MTRRLQDKAYLTAHPTSLQVTPTGTRSFSLDPKDLGIPRCEIADLAGGDATLNANLLMVIALSPNAAFPKFKLHCGIYEHVSVYPFAPVTTVFAPGTRTFQAAANCIEHCMKRLMPQDVFSGERNAIADALNLNAGVALHAANVASSPAEGVARAQEAQQSGAFVLIALSFTFYLDIGTPPMWPPASRRAHISGALAFTGVKYGSHISDMFIVAARRQCGCQPRGGRRPRAGGAEIRRARIDKHVNQYVLNSFSTPPTLSPAQRTVSPARRRRRHCVHSIDFG